MLMQILYRGPTISWPESNRLRLGTFTSQGSYWQGWIQREGGGLGGLLGDPQTSKRGKKPLRASAGMHCTLVVN